MGHGSYSVDDSTARSHTMNYSGQSVNKIFKNKSVTNEMKSVGVKIRESRDSNEHPNSLAIMIGLDVTGSMGSIPHFLISEGLTNIMSKLFDAGINDPQVLFLGIGDTYVDSTPLQVSQYESNDEILDKWLKDIYLEGGGGGNGGESYTLAWYFASNHTSIDCWEKRKEKGFIFTIGDDNLFDDISADDLKAVMGSNKDAKYKDITATELYEETTKKYNVYHIHVKFTKTGRNLKLDDWKEVLGDHLLIAENKEEISTLISDVIKNNVSHKSYVTKGGIILTDDDIL